MTAHGWPRLTRELAAHRVAKQVSQADLAERAGRTQRSISEWERGRVVPSLAAFTEVAEALGFTVVLQPIVISDQRDRIDELVRAVVARIETEPKPARGNHPRASKTGSPRPSEG